MKKGITGVLIAALFLTLAGCGTKQVSYEKVQSSGKSDNEINQEATAGTSLVETLGVEERWEEKVSLDGGDTFTINAEVSVPDVTEMNLMEVAEYYYTPEDKKRVAEYFLEEGSIQVDLEQVPTKESIAENIKNWDRVLEEAVIEEQIEVAKSEKKKQEDLLIEAPKADEIELSPGEYKQDYFKGSKEGREYKLGFDIDEEAHVSQWLLYAENDEEFNETGAQGWMQSNALSENKCTISEEEAEAKALKICEDLGITNMASIRVMAIEWVDSDEQRKEINGYYIVLGRENKGVAIEAGNYLTVNEMYYRNAEVGGKTPYEPELIDIGINDNGIFWMRYTGILSVEKEGTSVKLLGFDQIKEAFREEITDKNLIWNMNASNLDLIYFRIMDKKQMGKYAYVPAWRLSPFEIGVGGLGTSVSVQSCIVINAIDGTPVDMEEEGATIYIEPEVLLSAEFR